jgi:hypothetical protein
MHDLDKGRSMLAETVFAVVVWIALVVTVGALVAEVGHLIGAW